MPLRNIADVAAAVEDGRSVFGTVRKVPSQAASAGWWVDLSMAAGQPLPNYYASSPLVAATLDPMRGIFHGVDQAPAKKHLLDFGLMSPTAALVGRYVLADYVLYYPFVDGDSADQQAMDNTVTLPRYASGDGLMAIAVAVAPTAGGGDFTFTYRNQAGVVRTSPAHAVNVTPTPIASIVTSEQAQVSGGMPWLRLASGDTGIRSIESVTFGAPAGGLFAVVIVHPLMDLAIREVGTMAEINCIRQRPGAPTVEDGASLNLLCNPSGSVAAGLLAGYARSVWGG